MIATLSDTPAVSAAVRPRIHPYRYRMGDSIALLTLRRVIERATSPGPWFIGDDRSRSTYNVLASLAGMDKALALPPDGSLPDGAVEVNDVNLWIWNNIFRQCGIGLELSVDAPEDPMFTTVIAPLMGADYATGRIMHPRFVLDLIAAVERHRDRVCVLIPTDIDMHAYRDLEESGATLVRARLIDAIRIISRARLFIGGDTGLSHIAGCFPVPVQIALHDRQNLADHNEKRFDHKREHREVILAHARELGVALPDGSPVTTAEYDSFANKQTPGALHRLLFDNGGVDGATVKAVEEIVRNA